MKRDLDKLEELKREAKDRCIRGIGDKTNITKQLYQPWSPEVIGYNLKYFFSKNDAFRH